MTHEQLLAGERILILDDEPIIVLDLVETLTRAGREHRNGSQFERSPPVVARQPHVVGGAGDTPR